MTWPPLTHQDVQDAVVARAVIADISTAGTPTGDALKSAYVAGRACSTDGTNSLPTPTGVGMEFVITAAGLQDIRFNGASL
jgi:hypothetical protein